MYDLLHALIHRASRHQLKAQEHQAPTVESRQRQQVKKAQQRTNHGDKLKALREPQAHLRFHDADDVDRAAQIHLLLASEDLAKRLQLVPRQQVRCRQAIAQCLAD